MRSSPPSSTLLMIPFLSSHDAMSQDVLEQQKILAQNGPCFIYAQFSDDVCKSLTLSFLEVQKLLLETPSVRIVYHHGVFWHQGEEILQAHPEHPVILRYHSITPESFYKPYDHASFVACAEGRKQSLRLIRMDSVKTFASTSPYASRELAEMGVSENRIQEVAPFFHLEDSLPAAFSQEKPFLVLFVGRIVPNKGIQHLLLTLDRYLSLFGPEIHLNIVGSWTLRDPSYYQTLETIIREKRLASYVSFHPQISRAELNAFYKQSQAFLVMSEHEGFCVPVVEAQNFGLPVVSLSRTAVFDTVGEHQIRIEELDYTLFASALHRIRTQPGVRDYLRDQGFINQARYAYEKNKRVLSKMMGDVCISSP